MLPHRARHFIAKGSDMSATPDAILRRWFQEVWNEGNEAAIDRLMAADTPVHGLGGAGTPPMVGPDAFKALFRVFREAFGDLQIVVERTIVEGDMCAASCRVKAKHVGAALGGPPSGNTVEFSGVTMVRVRDGRLVEGWNSFDFLTMYQQIGWVANPPLPS
jgi:steroid delta-isomerase-like uncharacterized protein